MRRRTSANSPPGSMRSQASGARGVAAAPAASIAARILVRCSSSRY
jgi:hypothetical protein